MGLEKSYTDPLIQPQATIWRWGGSESLDIAGVAGFRTPVTLVDLNLIRPEQILVVFEAITFVVAVGFTFEIVAEVTTPDGPIIGSPSVIAAPGAIILGQTIRIAARVLSGSGKVTIQATPLNQ